MDRPREAERLRDRLSGIGGFPAAGFAQHGGNPGSRTHGFLDRLCQIRSGKVAFVTEPMANRLPHGLDMKSTATLVKCLLIGRFGHFLEAVTVGRPPGCPLLGRGGLRIEEPQPTSMSAGVRLGGKDAGVPQTAVFLRHQRIPKALPSVLNHCGPPLERFTARRGSVAQRIIDSVTADKCHGTSGPVLSRQQIEAGSAGKPERFLYINPDQEVLALDVTAGRPPDPRPSRGPR